MSKIWFIHGTYSSPQKLWVVNPNFCRRLASYLNATYDISFNWSGGNGEDDREAGAKNLARLISKWHESNPTEKIILVGHSHGGNVAILTANLLAKENIKIKNLITISTPVRGYRIKHKNVLIHNNVYNNLDIVQISGGDFILTIMDELKKDIWFEAGPAGRRFPNANNIEVPLIAFLDQIIKSCTLSAMMYSPLPWIYHMVKDHGVVIKNENLWRKYVEWRLRK